MDNEEMIQETYDELISALPEDMDGQGRDLIERAFFVANQSHGRQTRASGIPYVIHPISVATILVREMGLSHSATVAGALLHDVAEDTPTTVEEIRVMFGEEVAFLVDAVTKTGKGNRYFWMMMEAAKDDFGIVLVKLANRLHNLRTLSALRPCKQWLISKETMTYYVPLAGLLGFDKLKSELEDLSKPYL